MSNDTEFTDEEIQEFYADVCEVIDDHADNTSERYDLIDSLPEFWDEWMDNFGVSGQFWGDDY